MHLLPRAQNPSVVALIEMLALSVNSLAFAPTVMPRASVSMAAEGMAPDFSDKPWTSGEISDKAGLVELSKKLNPIVGYWGAPPAPLSRASPYCHRPTPPTDAHDPARRSHLIPVRNH